MTKVKIEDSAWTLIKELEVDSVKPLLSQLEKAWVDIPNACRAGMCAACMCHVVNDSQVVKNLRGEPAFPLWEWEIMTCIGWVIDTSDTITLRTMS